MGSGSIIMVGQLSEKGKKINPSTFSGPKPGGCSGLILSGAFGDVEVSSFGLGKTDLKECEAMQERTGLTIGLEAV
ncbi:MAG TPA: hypothetical protein VEM15_14295 [Thermodesulfobacteriota bacterium]|nr:hypothetical protein [Thermodesulfobacteriota bacterium]